MSAEEEQSAPQQSAFGAPETERHYEPIYHVGPEVQTKTNEEDEVTMFKMRAKLFRFIAETKEWKERGTGDVKILQRPSNFQVRLVMRRDKTYKVCANHYIIEGMNLSPNIGSDRSWVWSTAADMADGESTPETLAIRFANAENAQKFKDAFEAAQKAGMEKVMSTPSIDHAKEKDDASEAAVRAAEKLADEVQSSEPSQTQDEPKKASVVGKDEVELKKDEEKSEATTKAEDEEKSA